MARRLRILLDKFLRGLIAVAGAIYGFVLQTHAARLAIMALRLRRETPLPALLVGAAFVLCLYGGWSTGRSVYAALLPASPTGIGAVLAGTVASLVVTELTAAFSITLMTAALQLAYDTGRHRILSLLAIASALALGALAWRFADMTEVSLNALVLPALLTGGLVAMTIWFERAYLRPAYPGFRDFWADIVDARHYLNRAAHGE
jgi:hypothetical protein